MTHFVSNMYSHDTYLTKCVIGMCFYYCSVSGNFLITRIMTGRSVHQNGHFDSQFDEPSVLYRPLHDEVTETWDGVHTKILWS
jgi:hypothetical protein